MPLAGQLIHQRPVHLGPLVLETTPLKPPTPMADRDRTVSRRSEPSSRAALMGEQPNPWDLLQPQDATSRHRTFAPHSCGSRLYLHPALFRERARGQRLIAAIDLLLRRTAGTRYLTVLFRERTDQSLRGQTLLFERESTSHGIVPISTVHEMVGVHRYKLVHLRR